MSLQLQLDELSTDSLRRLHRGVVIGPEKIISLLGEAKRARVPFQSGVDRKSEPRTAHLININESVAEFRAPNLKANGQPQIYLHFDHNDIRYFFAAPPIDGGGDSPLRVQLPAAIYEAERRELLRTPIDQSSEAPRVKLGGLQSRSVEGRMRDWSYQGMAVALPSGSEKTLDAVFEVEVLDGEYCGQRGFAAVRRVNRDPVNSDWVRLGLEVSAVPLRDPFRVERRKNTLGGGIGKRAWRKVALASSMAKRLPSALSNSHHELPEIDVVRYSNRLDQEIVGLLDQAGSGVGGTAVVIPPAWGRTKETFLPLARTLVSMFAARNESLSVLRFDGTNRRGESFIDEECRAPGDEYLHYRFSRGVDDIRASLDFLRSRYRPRRVVLVTFSLGAVEGRRAAVEQMDGDLHGWVSVVGMVDLQSGLRTVSGGVDFAYGQSMGVEFGRHELVGVVSDMDFTGRDAFDSNLVFLEDAKRDMSKLKIPITWIHGKVRRMDGPSAGPSAHGGRSHRESQAL